jgi:hypothetical protein
VVKQRDYLMDQQREEIATEAKLKEKNT